MFNYIIRRMVIMLPTLIGITFLIFMMIALSPGGIGAALQQSGGQMESSQRFIQQAYLEDRYGLKDPVIVQYVRWLGRISPIKFGERHQRTTAGEVLAPPKKIDLPALAGEWYAIGAIPETPAPSTPPALSANPDERDRAYRDAANHTARARSALILANLELRNALRSYVRAAQIPRALDRDGDPMIAKVRRTGPDRSLPEFEQVVTAGMEALAAYQRAVEARDQLNAVYRARPYPPVGVALIPGLVSLGPPDLGQSFSRSRPVLGLISEALPVTLLLNVIAFPIIYFVAVPTGMLAAARRGSWFDVLSGATVVGLWAIPVVWAGVLALGYLASGRQLGWFPVSGLHHVDAGSFRFLPSYSAEGVFQRGYLLDTLWHVCLPVACLVYGGFAILAKQTRAAMLENISADYVRTARAKGVSRRDVLLRHVFRNSLLPLITLFATLFPALLSGSVVVERIFSVPGMGNLTLQAIILRDRELLLANVLMIGTVNIIALLIADILYAFADPRVSYD